MNVIDFYVTLIWSMAISVVNVKIKNKYNNEHDWTPIKYLNVLHHTKVVATIFLNISQKYYQLPIVGTLGMSGHFHQKGYYQLVETMTFICMQKMNFIPDLFFEIL